MPRKPRMYVAGMPCHVIQRGNNRQPCFFSDVDRRFYLACLGDSCLRYGVKLHAYVLMSNHVHLLMTPDTTGAISRVMQSLGRRYVQHVNRLRDRTGTLWESRHRASVVDAESYFLACSRYIELNPVRAGIVEQPLDYPWSSHRHNAEGDQNDRLFAHAVYRGLGDTWPERRARYRELFTDGPNAKELQVIRRAAEFSMPLGDATFRRHLEDQLERPLGYATRGRPARVQFKKMTKGVGDKCE